MSESRRGFLLGASAYLMWGLFPLYWPLLKPAGAVEILAHRVVWSLVVMAALMVALRRAARFRRLLADPRAVRFLLAAGTFIAVNWGMFIWAVNHGFVVETSLGYFINPLVTVLMGVVLLGERLRRLHWIAMGIAFVAVLVLTLELGRPPWIALVLAFSFGSYGLAKKKANAGAVESLTLETLLLAPVALAYLAWLGAGEQLAFAHHGALHVLLLAGTGLVTAIPLICFGAAATRVTMTTLGLLQYVTPSMQFLIGVLVFREDMSPLRWAGFALVWVALAVFTTESVAHRRRQLRLAAEAAAI